MNWSDLQKFYEAYDTPECEGYLNAEIGLLQEKKKGLELTPDQLRELATVNEKLEYLLRLRSSVTSPKVKDDG